MQLSFCVTSFAGHRVHGLWHNIYHGLLLGDTFLEHFRMDDSNGFFAVVFPCYLSRGCFIDTFLQRRHPWDHLQEHFPCIFLQWLLACAFQRGLFRAHFLVCSPCASSQNHLAAALTQGFLRCAFEQSLFSRALFTKSFSARSFAVLFQWVFSRVQPPCKLCYMMVSMVFFAG